MPPGLPRRPSAPRGLESLPLPRRGKAGPRRLSTTRGWPGPSRAQDRWQAARGGPRSWVLGGSPEFSRVTNNTGYRASAAAQLAPSLVATQHGLALPPPALPAVPGANGERLRRWPGARKKGLVRPRLHRPALPRGPSAPFIDRQISRRGPWRFQRRSQAPCWVAGSRAHLMAWTPNKPGAAFPAASGPDRGGGWGASRRQKLESREAYSSSGPTRRPDSKADQGAGETSGHLRLGSGPRPGRELEDYQETRSREMAGGGGESRANASLSANPQRTRIWGDRTAVGS